MSIRTALASLTLIFALPVALSGCPFSTRVIDVDGVERFILVDAPLNRMDPAPAVVVLHGLGGSGRQVRTQSEFFRTARDNGFIAVYPDGLERRWRFEGFEGNEADIAFLDRVVDVLIEEYQADPERIYFVGVSNGALMTYDYVCRASERVAAIAPVIGATMPSEVFDGCLPAMPVGVFALHNTDDPLLPVEGGEVTRMEEDVVFDIESVEESLAFWGAVNGCDTTPVVETAPALESVDGLPVRVTEYTGCSASASVQWYAIDGGVHRWPEFVEPTSGDPVPTSSLIWGFFDGLTGDAP